jgi:uncharacterized phage protein (TIGR01671 family)
MREIKFRGMALNGQWFYGNLAIIPNDIKTVGVKAGYYISNRAGLPFAYPVRPETVGQYTGLKDRNGTEIYEGDLLTDYGEAPPVYVEYSEEHGAYCFVDKFDPSGTVYYTPLMISYEQMEVIGNIYENSELLEEAK